MGARLNIELVRSLYENISANVNKKIDEIESSGKGSVIDVVITPIDKDFAIAVIKYEFDVVDETTES